MNVAAKIVQLQREKASYGETEGFGKMRDLCERFSLNCCDGLGPEAWAHRGWYATPTLASESTSSFPGSPACSGSTAACRILIMVV